MRLFGLFKGSKKKEPDEGGADAAATDTTEADAVHHRPGTAAD